MFRLMLDTAGHRFDHPNVAVRGVGPGPDAGGAECGRAVVSRVMEVLTGIPVTEVAIRYRVSRPAPTPERLRDWPPWLWAPH